MKKLLIFVSLSFLLFFGVANSAQYVHAYTDGEYNINITTVINGADNGAEDSTFTLENQIYGSLITPFASTTAPEGHKFSFWIVNGVVRKDLTSEHEFAVTANLEITGIFEPLDGSAHAVIFIDSNGKLIQASFVLNDQTVTVPSIEGYSKPQYVVATTPWKEANGNAAVFTNITESKVFVLQYELVGDVESVTITVDGTPQEYAYNEVVTVTADLEGFTHWEENGVVVSYDESYTFTALTNRELLAKNDGSSPQPLVTLSNVSGIRAGYKSFLGQVFLPSGFEIVELGLIASSEEKVMLLDDVNATVIPSNTIQANTKEFLRSFHESSFTTFRAYAVLRNGDNVVVEYSDNNYYSVPEVVGNEYIETFDNLNLGSSYASGSHFGAGNQEWFYTDSRGDQTLDGKALTIRAGSLTTTFTNGLSRLKFDYKRAFSNTDSRSFDIIINGDQIATITVNPSNDDIANYDSGLLSYKDEVNLEIKGTGNQKVIDNLVWAEQTREEINTRLYSVEFIDNDISTLQSIKEGHLVQEPVEPSKVGYTFIGWFKNDSDSEPYNFNTPIYEHLILHAKFTEMSDSEKLKVAKNEVEIGYNGSDTSTNVTDNVTLPISGLYGTIISWSSSDRNVISNEGVVTQKGTDTQVILTATISLNDLQDIREFILVVKAPKFEPELLYSYDFSDGGSNTNSAYASTELKTNVSYASDNPGGTSETTAWTANYANLSMTTETRLGGKLASTEYGSPSASISTDFTFNNTITKVEILGATKFGTQSNTGDIYLQVSKNGTTWETVSTKVFSSTIIFDNLNIEEGSHIKIVVQITSSSKNSGLAFTGIKITGFPN